MSLRILRCGDYPRSLGWILNAITGVLILGRQRDVTQTQRRQFEYGRWMSSQTKECCQPPEVREMRVDLSLEPPRGALAYQISSY
jgi:hypothetical protein